MLQLHFQALAFSSPSLLAVGSFFFFFTFGWLLGESCHSP